jgi:hypothetical protein
MSQLIGFPAKKKVLLNEDDFDAQIASAGTKIIKLSLSESSLGGSVSNLPALTIRIFKPNPLMERIESALIPFFLVR